MMPLRRAVGVFAVLLLSVPALAALSTRSIADGLTADEVASLLTGPGATITNVRITGGNSAIGSFSGGGPLGVESGVMLSSGNIADASGADDAENSGEPLGQPGHYTLDPLVSPYFTQDAMVLEFDVVTVSPTFAISYVFGSEEYREFVGTEYNDVFAFFVNGANIALTPGSIEPVTVNTINHIRNTSLYRDNDGGGTTELDGFTVPMLAVAVVEPNVPHHIRIAIADVSDGIYDSAVFIRKGGISGSPLAPVVIPDESNLSAGVGQTIEVPLSIYYTTLESNPNLSAFGIPGANVTFSPLFLSEDNRIRSIMTIQLGADTPGGPHVLTIRTSAGTAEGFTTLIVNVDCKPPSILGLGQPQTAVVNRGSSAALRVEPQGSGPYTYQWYQGFTGMTSSPVAGATSAAFNTPAVNEVTAYWVRIRNACGSVDSTPAFVIPR